MVWYSHLFKNFPQFVVIHTVKGIISFQISVIFFVVDKYSWSGITGSYGTSIIRFLEKLPYCFSQWLHQVPPMMYKCSLFSTS